MADYKINNIRYDSHQVYNHQNVPLFSGTISNYFTFYGNIILNQLVQTQSKFIANRY